MCFLSLQEIPAFRDFTIRDPLYFVIQFQASIHGFEEKKSKKKKKKNRIFFSEIFLEKFLIFNYFG